MLHSFSRRFTFPTFTCQACRICCVTVLCFFLFFLHLFRKYAVNKKVNTNAENISLDRSAQLSLAVCTIKAMGLFTIFTMGNAHFYLYLFAFFVAVVVVVKLFTNMNEWTNLPSLDNWFFGGNFFSSSWNCLFHLKCFKLRQENVLPVNRHWHSFINKTISVLLNSSTSLRYYPVRWNLLCSINSINLMEIVRYSAWRGWGCPLGKSATQSALFITAIATMVSRDNFPNYSHSINSTRTDGIIERRWRYFLPHFEKKILCCFIQTLTSGCWANQKCREIYFHKKKSSKLHFP